MGLADREQKRAGRGVVSAIVSETTVESGGAALKGRPKTDRETKKRVSLAILPSLYEDIQKIAYVERISVSEIASRCLERYAKENASRLEEYGKLQRGEGSII